MKKTKNMSRQESQASQSGQGQYGPETLVPAAFLEGELIMAFETRHECDKANLVASGAVVREIPFRWDGEIAKQRVDERLGLLRSNEQLKTITKYMLAVEFNTMAQAVTVEQAVILVLERRLKRRMARLAAFLSGRAATLTKRVRGRGRGEGEDDA